MSLASSLLAKMAAKRTMFGSFYQLNTVFGKASMSGLHTSCLKYSSMSQPSRKDSINNAPWLFARQEKLSTNTGIVSTNAPAKPRAVYISIQASNTNVNDAYENKQYEEFALALRKHSEVFKKIHVLLNKATMDENFMRDCPPAIALDISNLCKNFKYQPNTMIALLIKAQENAIHTPVEIGEFLLFIQTQKTVSFPSSLSATLVKMMLKVTAPPTSVQVTDYMQRFEHMRLSFKYLDLETQKAFISFVLTNVEFRHIGRALNTLTRMQFHASMVAEDVALTERLNTVVDKLLCFEEKEIVVAAAVDNSSSNISTTSTITTTTAADSNTAAIPSTETATATEEATTSTDSAPIATTDAQSELPKPVSLWNSFKECRLSYALALSYLGAAGCKYNTLPAELQSSVLSNLERNIVDGIVFRSHLIRGLTALEVFGPDNMPKNIRDALVAELHKHIPEIPFTHSVALYEDLQRLGNDLTAETKIEHLKRVMQWNNDKERAVPAPFIFNMFTTLVSDDPSIITLVVYKKLLARAVLEFKVVSNKTASLKQFLLAYKQVPGLSELTQNHKTLLFEMNEAVLRLKKKDPEGLMMTGEGGAGAEGGGAELYHLLLDCGFTKEIMHRQVIIALLGSEDGTQKAPTSSAAVRGGETKKNGSGSGNRPATKGKPKAKVTRKDPRQRGTRK